MQKQLSDAKRQSLETKKQLQDKIANLESKVTALEAARDFDKSASEHKIVSRSSKVAFGRENMFSG